MSRRNRTRPPGVRPVSTKAEAEAAREHGRDVRARQAYSLGRAIPIPRDPNYFEVAITPALVKEATDIIDRDPELIDWLAERLADHQTGPGRPSAVSLRTALICFWLMAVSQRNFHIINLAALVDALPWRTRRDLGIDYKDSRGQAKQISYNQLLRVFHNMADAFDPYGEVADDKNNDNDKLNDEDEKEKEEREQAVAYRRAADLQELCNRLLRASTGQIAHNGGYAVDATLKWAWERPKSEKGKKDLNSKIDRRGKDGEAGRPLTLTDVIDADADGDGDLETAGLVRDPLSSAERRKSRYDQSTWSGGADWVGRKNVRKSVFGYALHTAVVTDPLVPNVVEAMAVTTAKALPAPAIIPALRELFDVRTALLAADADDQGGAAAEGAPLATVVADPAYSANVEDWQLPLRAMWANPIFRLHRTNQAGMWEERGTLFIDGYPCCPCAAHALTYEHFPTFPYTTKQLEEHQKWTDDRARFEMKPNGNWLADGGRQFKYPHFIRKLPAGMAAGGCPHCVDAFGDAVIDPATNRPRPRCCTNFSKKFDAHELGLYQEPSHGSGPWMTEWNPRNRVEGGYGVLKNLALVNWGRDYHHFVGLAREALVATFALMAYNFHTQRTFEAWSALLADKAADDGSELSKRPKRKELRKPSAQPTLSTPQGMAAGVRGSNAPPDPFGPIEGPAGLEFIATPRGP